MVTYVSLIPVSKAKDQRQVDQDHDLAEAETKKVDQDKRTKTT